MWGVGTKVYVFSKLGGYRPFSTGHEQLMVKCYGTVTELFNAGFCKVSVTDDSGEALSGCFHKCELVNLGHHKPTYRVGDMVRICDLSEEEKLQYPGGWYIYMEEHIGQTARIARHVDSNDLYQLEGIDWIWHASNLKPASEFVGY